MALLHFHMSPGPNPRHSPAEVLSILTKLTNRDY